MHTLTYTHNCALLRQGRHMRNPVKYTQTRVEGLNMLSDFKFDTLICLQVNFTVGKTRTSTKVNNKYQTETQVTLCYKINSYLCIDFLLLIPPPPQYLPRCDMKKVRISSHGFFFCLFTMNLNITTHNFFIHHLPV